MARIIEFTAQATVTQVEVKAPANGPRSYTVDISAFSDSYIEFTASNVRTDSKSLSQIADELEKVASIIRSDVISKVN